jgi:RNA recognition motif-containing protein
MGKKLYVGNLRPDVTDGNLRSMFTTHGTVESARVVIDRETGSSKGFGYVEMKTDEEAQAAVTALHGQDSGGRALTVREAKPRPEGWRDSRRKSQPETPPAPPLNS